MDSKSVKIPNILRAKIAIVGESQVGKTSFVSQLTSDGRDFPKNYLMTQCAEVKMKSISIPDTNDVVELYLVDCSGREIYNDLLAKACWNDAAMIVAMYDVTNEKSFGLVTKWLEQVTRTRKENDSDEESRDSSEFRLNGVLVGNKVDLTDRRVVSSKMGSELAQQLGLMYFECSCKDFQGVDEPSYHLANEYHKMHENIGEKIINEM